MSINFLSCNTSPLTVFVPDAQNPWDAIKIRHLHNRFGFGIETAQIANALSKSPEAYVDQLVDAAINLAPTVSPAWAPLDQVDYAANGFTYSEESNATLVDETQYTFIKELIDNGVRGRMTLFWHNHLVTRANEYEFAGYAFRYFLALQKNCIGNFKSFISEMGKNDAMLKFLNGFENTAGSPNENYARELYELFTLGEGNGYTEDDIVHTARALTGFNEYVNGDNSSILFNEPSFDIDDKTIFGQTGNWGYDDVIDILFQEKADLVANYICTKLYAYFVSPEINETIVTQLATTFVANNFELVPVYKQLFKSNHFFDELAMGTIVKSPFDVFNCFFNDSELFVSEQFKLDLIWFNGQLGQWLFDPTDVAGWQGNHDWINSSTLIGRWQGFEYFLWDIWDNYNASLSDLALRFAAITETDPALITQLIVDHFITEGLQTAADYTIATDVFKDQIPQNYYDNNLWNLSWDTVPYQVIVLLFHITKLPEFQLK
jgi:uncharacterized protein (DUF1800 family)